ncbi:MAG: hypothetical protein ABSD74_02955 [Rhizomicrobium sp.]|jgi:hypothetical protein
METPSPRPKPDGVAIGIMMIVFGALIFIPSGLCTGVMGGAALMGMIVRPGSSEGVAMLVMALIFGGPFVVGGGALIWFGVKRLRAR